MRLGCHRNGAGPSDSQTQARISSIHPPSFSDWEQGSPGWTRGQREGSLPGTHTSTASPSELCCCGPRRGICPCSRLQGGFLCIHAQVLRRTHMCSAPTPKPRVSQSTGQYWLTQQISGFLASQPTHPPAH